MLLFQIAGAAILLAAFAALQFGISPRSDLYLAGNIIGATMLATSAWIELQWGFAVLNTVWAIVVLRSALKEEAI
jgi:hypothetical protein